MGQNYARRYRGSMPDYENIGPELELTWPPEIFQKEARDITALYGPIKDSGLLLLEEAFADRTLRNEFEVVDVPPMFRLITSDKVAEQKKFLKELADHATSLPYKSRAPYWTSKSAVTHTPDPSAFRRGWYQIASALGTAGYFSMVTGDECPVSGDSDNDEVKATMNRVLKERLGISYLWPPTFQNQLYKDDNVLYGVVEVLHDLAARPRRKTTHDEYGCKGHFLDHARVTGRAIYRWRVNELLEKSGSDLRLSESGADIGRLVRHYSDPRAELMSQIAEVEEGPNKASVEHAIALFRKRDATREDKRSACVALALVLEERRKMLKSNLLSKDEGMLFDIANNYDVRHRDGKQHSQFGDEFQDWIFWMYLGTVELTNRLIGRP